MKNFCLIVCTYMRPKPLLALLKSVKKQTLYPSQIIIVDGSTNNLTKEAIEKNGFNNLEYYLVEEKDRGLTKQRNIGIEKTGKNIAVVCFLDDDTILEKEYFERIINTYIKYPDAIAVGGYITNEVEWKKKTKPVLFDEFEKDGHIRKIGKRNLIRKRLGLLSDQEPGIMPFFSNGFPVSFLPPTDRIYKVEYFMGGVSSYKKNLFHQISFSNYFEGYGLYEDLDFCLRTSKIGKLYVNTAAKLAHHHEVAGRPNKYAYGSMVVRNGWYVWRIKYSKPSLKARFKWNAIVLLQIFLRGVNVFTTNKRKEALTETFGRISGWFSLLYNKPTIL
ncbi:MAG: glycosyltransferase [Flavobacteriaceae bacterium]